MDGKSRDYSCVQWPGQGEELLKKALFFICVFLASTFIAVCKSLPEDNSSKSAAHGSFRGSLVLQELAPPDGIHRIVKKTYTYTDPMGHKLEATPGFETDGASIPRVLWSIVGGPFDGKYVGAAVIHDVGCVEHKYSWQITHRMFYEAMIALGVDSNDAKLMYYGVRIAGPRWKLRKLTADSIDELNQELLSTHGTPIGPIRQLGSSGLAGGHTTYSAQVYVTLPTANLLDQDLQRFKGELERRRDGGQPISVEEIESRSEAVK